MKNAAPATGASVGFDAGKLVKGRKRLVLLDTRGNGLASRVLPAHVSDAAAATAFWDEGAARHPLLGQVQLVLGDSPFAGLLAQYLQPRFGLRLEKPAHMALEKNGFFLHQQRWLVERTLSGLTAACRKNMTAA